MRSATEALEMTLRGNERAVRHALSGHSPMPNSMVSMKDLFLSGYRTIWLPVPSPGFRGDVRYDRMVFKRESPEKPSTGQLHACILRALTPHLESILAPRKLAEILGLGRPDGTGSCRLLFPLSEAEEWPFRFLGLPRVRTPAVVREAILQGIRNGDFGYLTTSGLVALDELPPDLLSRVRIGCEWCGPQLPAGSDVYLVAKEAFETARVYECRTPKPPVTR
jgi:hypothetical protein